MPETLRATTREQARALLLEAHAKGASVLPCGRGSRLHRFLPEARPDHWLSVAGMQQLLWLDVEDQTCAVEAGMSLAALQDHLRPHGLQLDVLAPNAVEGTLGGIFLSREISLLEESCGPTRDQVLGATWLLADGKRVKSGARVVKSVAGYDVTRLLLGSRGRLALCLDLTLRLRPLPPPRHWFTLERERWNQRPVSFPEPRLCLPGSEDSANLLLAYTYDTPGHPDLASIPQQQGEAALVALLQESARGEHDPPLPEDSPWLHDLAEACAPGAPHFGMRP